MKMKIPGTWKSSVQPRKQRRWLAQLPLHLRHRILASHLSKDLCKKTNMRSITVRKGDKVKILRGEHKGKTGAVIRVDTKKCMVFVEGIEIERKNGMKVQCSIHPSKLMIIELHEDKKRFKQKKEKKEENK